jgi:hypothetical protein
MRGPGSGTVTAAAARMPDYRVDSVTVLGEGLDNVAYEVNGELIARFSKAPDPERLAREARLLSVVAAVAPVPVPEPTRPRPASGCPTLLHARARSGRCGSPPGWPDSWPGKRR